MCNFFLNQNPLLCLNKVLFHTINYIYLCGKENHIVNKKFYKIKLAYLAEYWNITEF